MVGGRERETCFAEMVREEIAKRGLVFRDGKIHKDSAVLNRRTAMEVLKTLPTLED